MTVMIFGSFAIIGAILFFTEVIIPLIGGLAALYGLCKRFFQHLLSRSSRKKTASYKGEFLN